MRTKYFQVLGDDDYITIDPPVYGKSKFYGNDHNSKNVPPKVINFQAGVNLKVCVYSSSVTHGHTGFKAKMTETPESLWVVSPNYPEDLPSYHPYLTMAPPSGYGAGIDMCWVRIPSSNRQLEVEFFQFDVSLSNLNCCNNVCMFRPMIHPRKMGTS